MKISIKKSICSFLAMVILFSSFCMPAFAQDNGNDNYEIAPYFTTITTCGASLTKTGLKTSCSASMTAPSGTKLKIKMDLQLYKSGKWTTEYTWQTSKTGTALELTKVVQLNPLYKARLKSTFTANSETVTVYRYN